MMLQLLGVIISSNFLLLASSDDNLELLSSSLRQLHRSGCTELNLNCPRGTNIALVSAKYSEGVLCPGENSDALCHLPSTLQYSVLQTAVEKCQKKRSCKLLPAATSYGTDPCPSLSKHLHVTYTCRPYEFRSKTACENEVVHLTCGPNSRLTVYSASYGRTQYESVQCPQPQGVPEETCLASFATETVIRICHGKRRCMLSVDEGTFGTPCKKESRMYLKVVYTCVPRRVLLPSVEEGLEDDETPEADEEWLDYEEEELAAPNTIGQRNNTNHNNETVTLRHNSRDVVATSIPEQEDNPTGKVRRLERTLASEEQIINCTVHVYAGASRSRTIGFLSEWMFLYNFLENNKERLSLYLAVSIGGGLLCVLLVLVAKLAWGRRSNSSGSAALPHYVGELYPGETDLSIATALPLDPNEVVRYSGMDMPRSLAASANHQYYYG